MRIIGGKARGTKLYTLEGLETRPTLDRVKESLFNILKNDIKDKLVLDLFAGSGAIGLEFISRGAKKTYLCDTSKDAIQIINKNVIRTHFEENAIILNIDFEEAVIKLKNEKFDLIYIDPPYKTNFIEKALEIIIKEKCIKKDSIIILETDNKEKIIDAIENLKCFKIIDERKYGRVYLIFLQIDDSLA